VRALQRGASLDGERRQSFASKVKGMPDEAVEMIMKAQPDQRKGSELETLSLIGRLENADIRGLRLKDRQTRRRQ
jgi:hypothetical protein